MLSITAAASAALLVVAGLGVLVTRSARSDGEPEPARSDGEPEPARPAGGAPFKDGKFHNALPGENPMARGSMLKTMREFLLERDNPREPTAALPVVTRSAGDFAQPPASGLRVTWLGHSTMLIEIDGRRLLTDPMWSERSSPVSFSGPKRFFPPPLPLDQLPPLDAVLISHDHFDHLDKGAIRALHPRVPLFVVPLEVGAHLRGWGVPPDKVRELDWWQETRVGELRLVCAPARHFSGRGPFNMNATLWASWAVLGPVHRAFFSGDSGMAPSFAEIGARLGPFDVTMIEIGAYHRNWADMHAGPEQAVQAHRDLRGELLLPIHWGTFNLALHGWTEPAERLLVAAERHRVRVAIPRPGGSLEPAAAPAPERWWPQLPWSSAEQTPLVSPGLAPEPERDPNG